MSKKVYPAVGVNLQGLKESMAWATLNEGEVPARVTIRRKLSTDGYKFVNTHIL
jgi:hypothetical protein